MKQFTKILTAISLSAMLLSQSSCKKEDPVAPAIDIASALQANTWRQTALTITPAYMGITDVYNAIYEACNKDDLFNFNAGNIFVLDEGPSKCDPMDEQTHTGTWSYDKTSNTLHYNVGPAGMSDQWDLDNIQMDANSFSGTAPYEENGVSYTFKQTFTKQ